MGNSSNPYKFVMTSSPGARFEQLLADGLAAHDLQHGVAEDHQPLAVKLYAPNSPRVCVGGLLGFTRWGWLEITHLWIAPEHQRHGQGAQLLREAERQARRRGCRHAAVATYEWHALEFYVRQGYVCYATVRPGVVGREGSVCYMLRKELD